MRPPLRAWRRCRRDWGLPPPCFPLQPGRANSPFVIQGLSRGPFQGSGGHFETPVAFSSPLGRGQARCARGSWVRGRAGEEGEGGDRSWPSRDPRGRPPAGSLIGSGWCNRISAIVILAARARPGGPGPLRRRAATPEKHSGMTKAARDPVAGNKEMKASGGRPSPERP